MSVHSLQGAALTDAAAIAVGKSAPMLVCNHGIKKFSTYHVGFYCDVCGEAQDKGSIMFGCRKCDYDQCLKCHDAAMALMARVDAVFDMFDLDGDEYLCKPEYRSYVRNVEGAVYLDEQWDELWERLSIKHDFQPSIGMSKVKFRLIYREHIAHLDAHEQSCGLSPRADTD